MELWGERIYRRVGLTGACIQGFGYVYFSCFGILLFAIAGVLGYVHRKQKKVVIGATLGIAVLGVASVINLAPALVQLARTRQT